MENNKNEFETVTVVDEYGCIVSIEIIGSDGCKNKYVFVRDKKEDENDEKTGES